MECKPDCCGLEQRKITAQIGDHPIYDSSCCIDVSAYVPADGAMISKGDVVFFTGNTISLDVNGVSHDYAEVDTTDAGKGVGGIALWLIDNNANDVGSTQFLTSGRVFANRINLNGADIPAMKAAGFDVTNVYK